MFRQAVTYTGIFQPATRASRFHKPADKHYQAFASHFNTSPTSSACHLLASTRQIHSPLSLQLIHLHPHRACSPFRRYLPVYHASTRPFGGAADARATSLNRRDTDLRQTIDKNLSRNLDANLGENLDNNLAHSHDKSLLKNLDQRPDEDPDETWRAKIAPGTPYLEAYDILEEFADVLLLPDTEEEEAEEEDTATAPQSAFAGDDVESVPPASFAPLPASLIPGPKSWPLVGCLPYMLRHPGQFSEVMS